MKTLILLYGVICYAIGMAGLFYFILFVGGWDFLPVHIESREPGPPGTALLVNFGLMALWSVQHTVMARQGFKEAWTKIIPKPMERATYVLISGILMFILSFYWQPIGGGLWNVEGTTLGTILVVLYAVGWFVVVLSSFLINHFELFGLYQVWLHFKQAPEPAPKFTQRFLYKIVRHPLQFGILMGLWFTPNMSTTHLCLAVLMTIYILIGLHYEEIDLENTLGDDYRNYKNRVRGLVPLPKRS